MISTQNCDGKRSGESGVVVVALGCADRWRWVHLALGRDRNLARATPRRRPVIDPCPPAGRWDYSIPGVAPSCAFKARATIRKTKMKTTAARTRNHITQPVETCQIRVPSKINSAINTASGAIHNQRITRRPIGTPAPTGTPDHNWNFQRKASEWAVL